MIVWYCEYKNMGLGVKVDVWVGWVCELIDGEVSEYMVENILCGSDGWNLMVLFLK